MEEIRRTIKLNNLLEAKSFFLFGPRSTGKTWLIRKELAEDSLIINLLKTDSFTKFLSAPSELRAQCLGARDKKYIVIDEIQKIPQLLNEVHYLIEEHGFKFLLTGSSSRRLKKDGTNLLAGRAWLAELFPLTFLELGKLFELKKYLLSGGLPSVYLSNNPMEELYAYVDIYLKEEIMQEALVRNLPAFSRFLKTVAISDGQIINYTNIGNDAQVSPSTIREYFNILEDTLIGFSLPAWKHSKKRKAIQTSKFYLFDPGIGNVLREVQNISPSSDLFGLRFEQFIAMEIRAYLSYSRKRLSLNYWRSVNGQEVDFLIGDSIAIEVKSTSRVSKRHRKGLKALKEESVFEKFYLVSLDLDLSEHDGIIQIYWKDFLTKLWSDLIV